MNRQLLTAAGFFLSGLLQAQIPSGAIAAYPFCGNANDMIGTNNGAVVGATLTADRFGVPNHAYYFNGQPNCYINLGTSNALKPLVGSISVWARPDGFSSLGSGYLLNPVVLTKNQPGNSCYEGYAIGLVTANGPPQFHGTITLPPCAQSNAIYTGITYQNWYHIVLTWDFDSVSLYVNGSLQQRIYKGFPITYLSGDSVMVGNSANIQNNRFFLGAIDDIIIYPEKLTPAEVLSLYNTPWNCSTGMPRQDDAVDMDLFPNPVSDGKLFITGLPGSPEGKITIYDASGRLLFSRPAKSQIDAGGLAEGLYFLCYSDNRVRIVKKFIVGE